MELVDAKTFGDISANVVVVALVERQLAKYWAILRPRHWLTRWKRH